MKNDGFEIETPGLRESLEAVKAFSPALYRVLRRDLRGAGKKIIDEQKAELDKPLPPGIRKSGTRVVMVKPRDGRKAYQAIRNTYEDAEVRGRRGSTGMREKIKAGLSTRVVATAKREGINIRTNIARAPVSIVWQSSRFRHPVFGERYADKTQWVDQQGQPYFWSPVQRGFVHVRQAVADAIDKALAQIPD